MGSFATTALLVAALALPVLLFLMLQSRPGLGSRLAAAIAIAAGWALNVAWAFAVQSSATNDPAQAGQDTVRIATAFGWACPSVLVLVTWLAWRYVKRRAA